MSLKLGILFAAVNGELPWLASEGAPERIQGRFASITASQLASAGPAVSCMPTEFASTAFQKGFGTPGTLKSHEWLLLAGPIGKYALQDAIPGREQRNTVFMYLDLLGSLWAKSFTRSALDQLIKSARMLLADLELLFPAWELDINRHMMQHLVDAIKQWGPPWVWSAFGYERLWGRLCEWMLNRTHPEACIMLGWRALRIALHHLGRGHQTDESFHFTRIVSFDRATNEVVIPGYLEASFQDKIIMSDGGSLKPVVPRPGQQIKKDLEGVWIELHQFYCRWPDKCKQCDCNVECSCPSYLELWLEFVNSQGISRRRIMQASELKPRQIAELLPKWPIWARNAGKPPAQQVLCKGPSRYVQLFDRARLGIVQLVGSKQETRTKAKNSVVAIMEASGECSIGRVTRFFRHVPPGRELSFDEVGHEQLLSQIAAIEWFKPASKAQHPRAKLTRQRQDHATGIPVIKASKTVDTAGNFWDCHHLIRKKFGLAAHPLRPGDLMLLSRLSGLELD